MGSRAVLFCLWAKDQKGSRGVKGDQGGSKGIKGGQRGSRGVKGDQGGSKGIKGGQRGSRGVKGDQGGSKGIDMVESGMRAFLSKKVLLFLWIVANHAIRGRGRLDPPRKVFRLNMHFCT